MCSTPDTRAAITAGADVMNSPLTHVLRTLKELTRCAPTLEQVPPQELVRSTSPRACDTTAAGADVMSSPLAHVLRVQRELVRCAPPLAHVLQSLKELTRCAPTLEQVPPQELVRSTSPRACDTTAAGADVMSSPLAHVLRVQRELVRCAPPLAHVLQSLWELARCASSPMQMLRSPETAPCTPPLKRVH